MAKRRAKGEGSVFQRSDGYWVARVTVEDPLTRRKHTRSAYANTQAEVLERLAELKARLAYGAKAGDETLGLYLDRWMSVAIKPHRRPKTVACYEDTIKLYLRPGLGHIPLAELTKANLVLFFEGLRSAGKSAHVIRQAYAVLRSALNYASDTLELIASSPLDKVPNEPLERKTQSTWTPAQAVRFLDSIKADPMAAYFELSVDTGARQGELLGLHWTEVDLKATPPTVAIEHQVVEVRGEVLGRGPPKSRSRTVPIGPRAVAALKAQRARVPVGEPRVFPGDPADLGYVTKAHMRTVWNRLVTAAKLPYIRMHDLRHTCATLLLKAGESLSVISQRLGHSSIAVTHDVYSHVDVEMQTKATDRLAGLLDAAQGQEDE